MSYEEADVWEEAAIEAMYEQVTSDPAVKERFYEELYEEIVKNFTANRLTSFYEENPHIAAAASNTLDEAKAFLPTHNTAAFVFAYIAAEVCVTNVLFKPIVYGLVHSESAAALITKLAIKHSDENMTKILLDLLATNGGVDPRAFKRLGSAQSVWEELKSTRQKRNRVFHQAEPASKADAELAISVADAFLRELFPRVVTHLGLHLHDSRVCAINHATAFASPPKTSTK